MEYLFISYKPGGIFSAGLISVIRATTISKKYLIYCGIVKEERRADF